jgi:hypothetical protein
VVSGNLLALSDGPLLLLVHLGANFANLAQILFIFFFFFFFLNFLFFWLTNAFQVLLLAVMMKLITGWTTGWNLSLLLTLGLFDVPSALLCFACLAK